MASKQQFTGMRGVYLVAAELAKLGFIASPTSRSALGADILVTSQSCAKAFSVQVKTNASTFGFWLVGAKGKELVAKSHLYVFVNLRNPKKGAVTEFFVVPSSVVAKKLRYSTGPASKWHSFYLDDAKPYQDKWTLFGSPI